MTSSVRESPRLIWAREMSQEINKRLLDHYADRQIWLIEPDNAAKVTKIRDALK